MTLHIYVCVYRVIRNRGNDDHHLNRGLDKHTFNYKKYINQIPLLDTAFILRGDVRI